MFAHEEDGDARGETAEGGRGDEGGGCGGEGADCAEALVRMGGGDVVPGSGEGEFGLKGEGVVRFSVILNIAAGKGKRREGLTTPLTCDMMKEMCGLLAN